MTEDNQFVIPPSFIALYLPRGAVRPNAPRAQIAARYELCEDLAQALTDQARDRLHALGVDASDVLLRIRDGLRAGGVVDAAEARWVLRRLAELLEWAPLADD